MLGVVVTETLYRTHPDLSEGRLAKLRAAVVNARALAEVGRAIGLGEHVKLGRGEETTGGRNKASILSDTVEAVIGAVHLSGGIEISADVVHRLFDPLIEAASALGAGLDWKTSLQELAAEHSLGVPEYVIEDEGPDHMKTFTAQVRVGDSSTATASAAPRRRPSRPPRRRRTARSPTASASTDPAVGPRTCRSSPARADRPAQCPSCPRSRSSAPASTGTSSARRSPASRCCTRARCAATCAARPASPPR